MQWKRPAFIAGLFFGGKSMQIMICKSYRRLGTPARPPVCRLVRSGKSAQATFPRELGYQNIFIRPRPEDKGNTNRWKRLLRIREDDAESRAFSLGSACFFEKTTFSEDRHWTYSGLRIFSNYGYTLDCIFWLE